MKKVENILGREIPSSLEAFGELKAYEGLFLTKPEGKHYATKISSSLPNEKKLVATLKEALIKAGAKDGMRISFHHHLRNGDLVLCKVIDELAEMGIKDLTLSPSSLTDAHEPLLEHIKSGVITSIETSGLRGKIGKEVSRNNILKKPIMFRSHGGRARAIESGEIVIDIAVIAAPICDELGNMNGSKGENAFGAMGYPMVDAHYANKVIAVTDNLQPYPIYPISIDQTLVDFVVEVDSIGDASKISTGATRITKNPNDLKIAKDAADVLIASGLVKNGFSFQAGSGGASLAVVKYLKAYMKENEIVGSFASGGITMHLVELLEEGYFKALFDTQTFDSDAAKSFHRNKNHIEMSASMYANPFNKACVAHQLDIMILSATEVDVNFNINSLTSSLGEIMGALGGAPDTAAGSKLTVVVAPCIRGRIPILVDKVTTIVTPGECVDILVTERGICVNPKRKDLLEALAANKIEVKDIKTLKEEIHHLTGSPEAVEFTDNIVGLVEFRDGTIIDVIKQVKN